LSLLSIEHVSKRYRRGSADRVALEDVSLTLDRGELAVVLGTRKSGRSTLLRIASGLERPDQGTVRFEGNPIETARDVVGRRISYCHGSFSPMEGERVVDHVAATLLAQRVPARRARRVAEGVLARTAVSDCVGFHPDELSAAERVRVAIARGLVAAPRMLVIDDPAASVGLLHSSGVLRLLRSIADDGAAVLMSTDDPTCVSGADRAFSLEDGKLRAEAHDSPAEVVPLRPLTGGLASGASHG
jgi:ABC-type ATPase involved in cell division